MAENYGTLEGTLDEHGVLSGEMSDRATLEGEIQFGSGGGGVLDVFQNGQSVVEGRYAYVTVPTFLRELRSDDYHNTVTTLEIQNWNGKADPDDIPTALSDLQGDSDHRLVTDAEKTEWSNKSNVSANPSITTETLTSIEIDGTAYAIPSGGSGDVTDVKVNNASVVDAQGVANIDLTGYAEKSDLGTASSKDVPATGNAGANEVVLGNDTRLSDSRPASDVSSWAKADSKPTYQYSEIQNTPSLGTAAAKDFDNSVIDGSSNLVTGDAVHDAIDNAVSGAYKHAGTKTCAELISSLLVKANAGNVYNMTDSGTTTSDFIEGAGLPIRAGDNVGVAKIDENTYKFDLLSGFVDTSNFITKSSTSGLVKNDGSIDTTSYQPTESGKGLSTNDYDNIAKGKVDALGTASTKNVPTSGDAGNNEVVLGNDTRLTDARPASDVSAWAKESTKPSYTKSEVGLDNVDNTSDSTKKTNFTGSIASGDTGFTTGGDVYTALGGKTDKVSGATNGNLAGLNGSGNLTDSGWNGAKDTTSISGNPISISGLKSNQLAKNPIITLEPIQDLHGQSKPYPAGGGKNKLNMSDKTISAAGWVFNKSECVLSAGTYIFSWNVNLSTSNSCQFQVYDSTGNTIIADVVSNVQTPIQFTITQAAGYCRFYAATGGTFSKFMIRLSTESADYAPYENICPISGYDKVEALSCGVNVWNEKWELGQYSTTTGEKVSASSNIRCKDFIAVKPGETYYMCVPSGTYWRIFCYTENYRFFYTNVTQNSQNLVIPSGCHFLTFQFGDGYGTTYNNNISLNYPNTFTSYIACNKTTSISESLGQTLYRFAYDVRIGKITTQYVYTTFSGASDETIERVGTNVSGKWRFVLTKTGLVTIPWSDGTHKSGMLTTNILDEVTNTDTNACTVGIHYRANGGGNSFIAYFGDSYTTVDDVKALLQTTPLQIVYAIPTITTIQLTPHEISLLKDYAYVSTNGTSIALDYHNGELASLSDVSQLGETVNKGLEFWKTEDSWQIFNSTQLGVSGVTLYAHGAMRILIFNQTPTGSSEGLITTLPAEHRPSQDVGAMALIQNGSEWRTGMVSALPSGKVTAIVFTPNTSTLGYANNMTVYRSQIVYYV